MGSGVFSVSFASQRSPAEIVASLCHSKPPEKRLPTPSLATSARVNFASGDLIAVALFQVLLDSALQ